MSWESLVAERNFHDVERDQVRGLTQIVAGFDQSELSDVQEAKNRAYSRFELSVPQLDLAGVKAELGVAQVRVGHEEAFIRDLDPGQEIQVKVTRFAIPFRGEGEMFAIRPTTNSPSGVQGDVQGMTLMITIPISNRSGEQVRADFEARVSEVQKWLSNLEADCNRFNASLKAKVSQLVDERVREVTGDQEFLNELGL